jgi:hypothetical protein
MKKHILLLAISIALFSCTSDDDYQSTGYAEFQKEQFQGTWVATSIITPFEEELQGEDEDTAFKIQFNYVDLIRTFAGTEITAPYTIINDMIVKTSQSGVDDFYFVVNSVEEDKISARMVYGLPGETITDFLDLVLVRYVEEETEIEAE